MLLPRAIMFTCLVYFTQELHLSKRGIEDSVSTTQEATEHVREVSTKPATVKSEKGHAQFAFKNDVNNIKSNSSINVSETTSSETKNEVGHVQLGSENVTKPAAVSDNTYEYTINEFKKDVNDAKSLSESISDYSTNRSKREVSNVHSASENATEHADEAGKTVNADTISEISAGNADDISEKTTVNADVVSEKIATYADIVSEKSAVNDDVLSDKSAVNVVTVSEKSTEKSENASQPNLNLPVNGRRNNRQSKWCQNLKNCQPNKIEICGYDDKAGFAKFTDYCHLMEVNCHWGHDFTLHACKAMQLKQMGRPRIVFNK